jgi:uncharacterized protein YlzI (FlbEa/FlbD family)
MTKFTAPNGQPVWLAVHNIQAVMSTSDATRIICGTFDVLVQESVDEVHQQWQQAMGRSQWESSTTSTGGTLV